MHIFTLTGITDVRKLVCQYVPLVLITARCHIFFFLTWPPCIASMLNIRGWSSLPAAESSGSLVTVHIGLRSILCLIHQISVWLSMVLQVISVFLPPSLPILLSLSLSLQSFRPYVPPPSAAACPALIPRISRAGWYHHRLYRRSPFFCSTARHKYMIGRFVMNCVTVLWLIPAPDENIISVSTN